MESKFLFSPALDKTFGNAIISKQGNIFEHKTLDTAKNEEVRSACKVSISHLRNWDFAIINVHLDEKEENTRVQQVQQLIDWLKTEDSILSLPHILCGDFNALSDWSKEVAKQRSLHGFEEPSKELHDVLMKQFYYIDLETKNSNIKGIWRGRI